MSSGSTRYNSKLYVVIIFSSRGCSEVEALFVWPWDICFHFSVNDLFTSLPSPPVPPTWAISLCPVDIHPFYMWK